MKIINKTTESVVVKGTGLKTGDVFCYRAGYPRIKTTGGSIRLSTGTVLDVVPSFDYTLLDAELTIQPKRTEQ